MKTEATNKKLNVTITFDPTPEEELILKFAGRTAKDVAQEMADGYGASLTKFPLLPHEHDEVTCTCGRKTRKAMAFKAFGYYSVELGCSTCLSA